MPRLLTMGHVDSRHARNELPALIKLAADHGEVTYITKHGHPRGAAIAPSELVEDRAGDDAPEIGAEQARKDLAELIARAEAGAVTFITRRGCRLAAVVPVALVEAAAGGGAKTTDTETDSA